MEYAYPKGTVVRIAESAEKEWDRLNIPDHEYPGQLFVILSHYTLVEYYEIFEPCYLIASRDTGMKAKHFYEEGELVPVRRESHSPLKIKTLPQL